MASANVRLDYAELKKLKERIEDATTGANADLFFQSCAKELAARLLAKVIKRTPVGKGTYTYEKKKVYDYWQEEGTDNKAGKRHRYDTGQTKIVRHTVKQGGTLRRGWTGGNSGNASSYAKSLAVNKVGNDYVIEIINPVEYASYVEFGHRTRNHKGWVEGKFMLTISEDEIRNSAPRVLEKKLETYLKGCFK